MEGLARARLAAERLRTWLATRAAGPGDEERPTKGVPVDRLVAALGIATATFSAASQPTGTLGYLEPGEDLIFLRTGLAQAVRRFTLAHELGHAVLHRPGSAAARAAGLGADASSSESRCDSSDLAVPFDLISASDEQLTPGEAYSARSAREAEANAFAAALLLPTDEVVAAYLSPARPSIRTLATRFGVSEDMLLRRLTALLSPGVDESPAGPHPLPSAAGEGSGSPGLDVCQVEAARAATPALVIAGPGTGKTSTLVERVEVLVRDQGIPPEAILALTFSHKAARELRERVEARLGRVTAAAPERADANVETNDEPWATPLPVMPTVSTIHTFCGTLLRRYAPLVGLRPDFRLVTEAEGYFLLRELAPALQLAHYQPVVSPARYYPDLLAAFSRAKDELVGPVEYAALAERMVERAVSPEEQAAATRVREVAVAYVAYQEALERRGDPDFGDVVRLVVRLLSEHPDVLAQVRAQYRAVLVDEFQDINRAMGVLLRMLAGEAGPLWAVGDPDQAIYRFRGASPANIARFADEYPTGHHLALDQNHRSTPPVLHAAAAVAQAFLGSERPALQATRALARTPTVTLAVAADEAAEWDGIAASIRAHQAAGYALSDQAVLCRTRRQAQRLAAALEGEGIATRTLAPLLEQPDVLNLLAVVNLLGERSGAGLLRTGAFAPHTFSAEDAHRVLDEARARATTPTRLLATAATIPGISPKGARGLRALAEILVVLRSAPDVATGLSRYVFRLTELGRDLMRGLESGDPATTERAQHLGRLLALAHSFDEARRDAEGAGRGRAAWGEFQDYVRVLLLLRQERGGADDLAASADAGIWVLTVHASKGLEFPVVYLPGLAARRFPIQRQPETVPLPPGLVTDAAVSGVGDAHVAEEASLFYVALTRARDALVLSFAERYGALRSSASPFLPPVAHALGSDLARVRWQGHGLHQGELREAADEERADEAQANGHHAPGAPLPLARSEAGPVSVVAVETYLRCPRQYAYRHVYGLRAQEHGARALRQALRATLRALESSADTTDAGHSEVPATLEEVRALFDAQWAEVTGEAAANAPAPEQHERGADGGDGADESNPAERAFESVYQRHGHQMIERAWRALVAGEHAEVGEAVRPVFDEELPVRVGAGEVLLPVDRVERVGPAVALTADAESEGDDSGDARHAERASQNGARAVRLIRQRAGRAADHADDRPDVRALLYHLAAQQQSQGGTAQVYAEYLESGEMERVALSSRQIERLRAELDRALDGIAAGHYPPKRSAFTCAGCAYALICPA